MSKDWYDKSADEKIEDMQQMADILAALNDLVETDPDDSISPEAQSILLPVFRAAKESVRRKDMEFFSGNVSINPETAKKFIAARDLLKEMESGGIVTDIRAKIKKSRRPQEISCAIMETDIRGDLKDRLSDIIRQAYTFEPSVEIDNSVRIIFRFDQMWIRLAHAE